METGFLLLIGLYIFCAPTYAKYGGGTGEPNDPYLIYTAEQMNAIGTEPNDWDKHFILMADIDLSQYTGTEFNMIGYYRDWNDYRFFSGVFDGNGHTILRLTVQGKDYLGLFGQLQSGAEVRNLGVVDVNIAASGGHVGGLVGYNNECSVTHCYSSGEVSGGRRVGGQLLGR